MLCIDLSLGMRVQGWVDRKGLGNDAVDRLVFRVQWRRIEREEGGVKGGREARSGGEDGVRNESFY